MCGITIEIIKACILGHAIGDALGVPVEFRSRARLDADPVISMRGFGSFPVPAGSWSDDTSMTLCALDALAQEHFTWESVMENFGKWYYRDKYTPTGVTFDIGQTCAFALEDYFDFHVGIEACGRRDEQSNGNGSLMRIIPFALYAPEDIAFIENASCLTHAHRRSQIACGIYSMILNALINHQDKNAYRIGLKEAQRLYGQDMEWKHYAALEDIETRSRDSIRSSGYVVDTLEAALWCLLTTESYADCVLKAVNLGEDTDTVAAVAGGLAGAVYGLDGIPQDWLDTLLRKDYIEDLCEKACKRWNRK